MSKDEFEHYLNETVGIIQELPDHSDEELRIASEQLAMLHYSFMIGQLDIDIPNIRKKPFIEELKKLAVMSFDELAAKPNFEKAWNEASGQSKEEWAYRVRADRIRLASDAFILMSRLRSNEPEAWDEVNELVFDD